MTYLLILYFGLHATTPSAAMTTGPLTASTCTEMAEIGADAEHQTSCVNVLPNTVFVAVPGCKVVDTSDGPVILTTYSCGE